jgi:hypothetical protein
MMGDPTSFPIMPLISAYGSMKVGHPRCDGKFTGDDASLSGFPKTKVSEYNDAVTSLGGNVNTLKSFWDPNHALFCEVPFINGIPEHYTLLSTWNAPPGGSKGQITWASQALVAVQQNIQQGRPRGVGLWEYSPLWHMQKAAYLIGLPIGAPPEFGGISHPKFPASSTSDHLKWLSYMSGLDTRKLLSGTGLSLMPTPFQEARAKAASFVMDMVQDRELQIVTAMQSQGTIRPMPRIVSECAYDGPRKLVSIEAACDEAAAPLVAWEFYYRKPIIADAAPSIRKAHRKFSRKIYKSPLIKGSFSNVKREVARKQSLFLRKRPPVPAHKVSYGLETSNPLRRYRLPHWVAGRTDWR